MILTRESRISHCQSRAPRCMPVVVHKATRIFSNIEKVLGVLPDSNGQLVIFMLMIGVVHFVEFA